MFQYIHTLLCLIDLQTIFYREQRGRPRETIVPPLSRGQALLHR